MKAQEFYGQHYRSVAWFRLPPGIKIFTGDRTHRICRFCGRSGSAAKFRKRAHAFPEFIGNHTLFANDECDDCNSRFGQFEAHLSKYLGLEITISQIKGKKHVPKYKVRDQGPSVFFDAPTKKLLAEAHVDDRFIHLDMNRQLFTIQWQRQPYIRRMAFKCLVKMALSIAPLDILPDFAQTIRWIASDDLASGPAGPLGSACFRVVRSRSVHSLRAIEAVLLTRRHDSDDLPYATFFISFHHHTFQIFIPFTSKDGGLAGREIKMPHLPNKMERFSDVFFFFDDMSSNELLQNDVAELNFTYDGPITIREA